MGGEASDAREEDWRRQQAKDQRRKEEEQRRLADDTANTERVRLEKADYALRFPERLDEGHGEFDTADQVHSRNKRVMSLCFEVSFVILNRTTE